MSEYADNIRRIVGVKKTKGGIDPQKELQPIGPGRGVAWFNADGSIGSGSGTAPGAGTPTVQPDDAFGGDQSEQTTGTNGGTSYGAGPGGGNGTLPDGTTSNFANDGVVPATSLFDGSMGIGDSFTGISGLHDCATGDEFQLNYDAYPDVEGWDDPDTPGPAYDDPETYTEGMFWFFESSPGANGATLIEACEASLVFGNITAFLGIVSGPNDVAAGSTAGYTYDQTAVAQFTQSGLPTNHTMRHAYCGAATYDACTIGLTYETEWPSDGVTQLKYNSETSQWETSEYESDAPLSYQTPVSTLELCDAEGNTVTDVPAKGGGRVITNATQNLFIVRDAAGKVTAAGSGSNRDFYVAN